jgi:hypothetical protein
MSKENGFTPSPTAVMKAYKALTAARRKLYSIAGGSRTSGNPRLSHITTAQRMEYFRSAEFRAWVKAEKAAGREVFWLKDVDKTQGAGDVFTFFFKWRADNNKFSPEQLDVIAGVLSKNGVTGITAKSAGPQAVIDSWLANEAGGKGLGMMEFWAQAFWPSQFGLTREEKLAQVTAFAPQYASRIYPGVKEENELLEETGVHVVIVSNGDQELAIACAPYLGVKPENVVGSNLLYNEQGVSTGVNHSYEVFGDDWHKRPQPGKPLSFHYWLHMNRARFGWDEIDEERFVIAGRDGDSGSTDGGMMIMLQTAAIGNFMVNTPGEPKRIAAFYDIAQKYGFTRGQFITLDQMPSKLGFKP